MVFKTTEEEEGGRRGRRERESWEKKGKKSYRVGESCVETFSSLVWTWHKTTEMKITEEKCLLYSRMLQSMKH